MDLLLPRALRSQLRFQLPIVIVLLSNSELASLYGFLNSRVIQIYLLVKRVIRSQLRFQLPIVIVLLNNSDSP